MIVIIVILFWGDQIMGIPSGRPADVETRKLADAKKLSSSKHRFLAATSHADAMDKISLHYTVLYNSFVCMTLFNEFNARMLHDEKNIFSGIFNNKIFVIVMIGCIILQYLMVMFLSSFLSCVPLTPQYWGLCVIIGATVIPVRFIISFLPSSIFCTIGKKKQTGDIAMVHKSDRPKEANEAFAKTPGTKRFHNALRSGGGPQEITSDTAKAVVDSNK